MRDIEATLPPRPPLRLLCKGGPLHATWVNNQGAIMFHRYAVPLEPDRPIDGTIGAVVMRSYQITLARYELWHGEREGWCYEYIG